MQSTRPIIHKAPAVLVLAVLLICASAPATAEVTRVVVTSSGPMGLFDGREYIWVNAAMEGTVARPDGTTGHYRVPVVLMYPDRNPNGYGFVDIVNSAMFFAYKDHEAPGGRRSVMHLGDVFYSDFLKREGYTYISVQWSRMVTHALGSKYGVIEDGRDGYEIVKDAARFLRDPVKLEGAVPFRPEAVGRAIAFGYSQTAFLLRQFVMAGENRNADGSLVYDGILAGGGGGKCTILTNDESPRPEPGPTTPTFDEFVPCAGELPGDGKFISIVTQSEIEAFFEGHLARHQTPSYRQYELAGVAHIPPENFDVSLVGAIRQNPANFSPVFKAMLRNLVAWIEAGKAPPDSSYIEGVVDGEGKFNIETDSDGNVKGGLRLPHMPTLLGTGKHAGAPLGVYAGLDSAHLQPFNLFAWLGGTFDPFSAQELDQRYPSNGAYVELVAKSAAALLAGRFILAEDYEAYVEAAKRRR